MIRHSGRSIEPSLSPPDRQRKRGACNRPSVGDRGRGGSRITAILELPLRVIPRIVRLPYTCDDSSSIGTTRMDSNLISGYRSTSKKPQRGRGSRCSLFVSNRGNLTVPCAVDLARSLADLERPSNLVNFPRTLASAHVLHGARHPSARDPPSRSRQQC